MEEILIAWSLANRPAPIHCWRDLLKILLSLTDTFDQVSIDPQTIPMKDVPRRHASFDTLQSILFENINLTLEKKNVFAVCIIYLTFCFI